jgi:hypothetical protein
MAILSHTTHRHTIGDICEVSLSAILFSAVSLSIIAILLDSIANNPVYIAVIVLTGIKPYKYKNTKGHRHHCSGSMALYSAVEWLRFLAPFG